jgi:hypothetical protein
LSLQAASLSAHLRERSSPEDGCRVPDCPAAACELVEIELPAAWEASERYTVLTVAVAACAEHAPELRRRAAALLEARADLRALLAIVDDAIPAERQLRGRADVDGLSMGSRWYTRGHGPERIATLRGLYVGAVPKGRRCYAFAVIETPPSSGSTEDWKLDDFVNAWWRP